MSSHLAAFAFTVAIVFLFWLNHERSVRTSGALWIPWLWLMIAGSRNVSEWLQWGGSVNAADRYLEGSPVDRNVLTAIMLLGVMVLVSRRERVAAILRANTAIVLYFLYCGISIFWSDYTLVAGKRWFRSLGDVIMVLVVLTESDWRDAIKRLLTRVGFLLLPISILLIKYFPSWGRSYGEDGTAYWTGVAGGKNSLGMICMIFGLTALWCFVSVYRGPRDRFRVRRLLAHGAIAGMAVWLLLIVNSKTSLACFVLTAGLMIATSVSRFARRPGVLFTMVGIIVGGCFAVLFLGIGGDALQAMGRNASLTGRTEIWKVVLKFAVNPLLGAGYESFWLGNRLDQIAEALNVTLLNQAHNGYIEEYLNLGWVGVVFLMTLIVTGYRKITSGFRGNVETSALRIAFLTLAIVYNFTEGVFKTMSPVWLSFLFATMTVPEMRSVKARATTQVTQDPEWSGTPPAPVHSSR